uniref:Putative ovule protein n=1 Tax=Solanum chacoense TaxID=4108 RepID=A0A0V0GUH4_SOLCH
MEMLYCSTICRLSYLVCGYDCNRRTKDSMACMCSGNHHQKHASCFNLFSCLPCFFFSCSIPMFTESWCLKPALLSWGKCLSFPS